MPRLTLLEWLNYWEQCPLKVIELTGVTPDSLIVRSCLTKETQFSKELNLVRLWLRRASRRRLKIRYMPQGPNQTLRWQFTIKKQVLAKKMPWQLLRHTHWGVTTAPMTTSESYRKFSTTARILFREMIQRFQSSSIPHQEINSMNTKHGSSTEKISQPQRWDSASQSSTGILGALGAVKSSQLPLGLELEKLQLLNQSLCELQVQAREFYISLPKCLLTQPMTDSSKFCQDYQVISSQLAVLP